MASRISAAAFLRRCFTDCPNGCGELNEEHAADGLHVVCSTCGWFETEARVAPFMPFIPGDDE